LGSCEVKEKCLGLKLRKIDFSRPGWFSSLQPIICEHLDPLPLFAETPFSRWLIQCRLARSIVRWQVRIRKARQRASMKRWFTETGKHPISPKAMRSRKAHCAREPASSSNTMHAWPWGDPGN